MKIDNYYVVGLIYQYMRERLKPPVFEMSIDEFTHRSFSRSACYDMIERIKEGSLLYSVAGIDAFFDYWIEKLDDWACAYKVQSMSYFFSTQRDVVIDLRDYIIGNLSGEFPKAIAVRRFKRRFGL